MMTLRNRALAAILAGPVLFAALMIAPAPAGMPVEAWRLVAVLAWMVAWWLSEAVPLAATALLPIVVMPLVGIADVGTVTSAYGHPVVYLFLGGFMLAAAIEKAGLHRRIALAIVARVGTGPRRLMLGFMAATAALSMWITNTAATIMMFAVATSVIHFLRRQDVGAATLRRIGVGLMLSIAYSASIGGLGTLIGSPPNALLASMLSSEYGIEVGFADWMMLGLPVAIVMLAATWALFAFVLFRPVGPAIPDLSGIIGQERAALGEMGRAERTVAAVFGLAAIGWIFGNPISTLTGLPVTDTAVAIGAAVLLFAIPVDRTWKRFALDWEAAAGLPWNVLLLIGGGLAVGSAFQETGFATWIGSNVRDIDLPIVVLILIATTIMVLMTEIMSNTAAAATMLPVLAGVAVGFGHQPMLLAVPAAFAASMAFMMPVATPPNAIVFSHDDLKIADMVRAGACLNLVAVAVVTVSVCFVFRPLLGW